MIKEENAISKEENDLNAGEESVIETDKVINKDEEEAPSPITETMTQAPKAQKKYSGSDYLLIPVMAAAAFLYIRGASFFPGTWLPLFTVIFAAAGIFCLPAAKRRMDREGRTYLAFLTIAALWFLVKYLPGQQYWEQQAIMPYVTLFLHGMGVYWLLTVSGARLRGVLDESLICDLGTGFFVVPIKNFVKLFLVAASWLKQFQNSDPETRKKMRKTGQILFGLLMSVPVLMIVLPILAAADESFSVFLSGFLELCGNLFTNFFELFMFEDFWMNLLVIVGACYLYGLFYGSFHAKGEKNRIITSSHNSGLPLPNAIMISFSAAVCGVYALFFLVKFSDVLVKTVTMQQGYEYSEYARQGFFELCFIAVINFCLFYFIKVCAGKQNKAVKILLSLLCVETLGFIVLAFFKMYLYINGYGFTFKRVFTSWFMAVLFLAFSRLFYCLWKQGNAIKTAVLFGSVTFLLLAFSNMDAWMGQANLAMGFF